MAVVAGGYKVSLLSPVETGAQLGLVATKRREVVVLIHGVPQAWPRAGAVARRNSMGKAYVQFYEQTEIRSWKAVVSQHMEQARGGSFAAIPFPDGAVEVEIVGVHPQTVPEAKKYGRRARYYDRHHWRDRKPDVDNVAKVLLDCATKVLWTDDAQVACLTVYKVHGPDPRVLMRVRALPELFEAPELLLSERGCSVEGQGGPECGSLTPSDPVSVPPAPLRPPG